MNLLELRIWIWLAYALPWDWWMMLIWRIGLERRIVWIGETDRW